MIFKLGYKYGGRKNISLFRIAQKLGLSEEDILTLLEDAGFDTKNSSLAFLNEHHLEVLSRSYIKSIKSYYSKVSKNHYELDFEEQNNLKLFFSKFIQEEINFSFLKFSFTQGYEINHKSPLDRVFVEKLDDNLIKNFFHELIFQHECNEYSENLLGFVDILYVEKIFHKIKHRFKIKLNSQYEFSDIRSRLYSILICCHYYIFSDDEDHIGKATPKESLSDLKHKIGEALNEIIYLKFSPQWKILKAS